MTVSREVRLRVHPTGAPQPSDFELATIEVPPPPEGRVQVRNRWMSVDPYMRGRMNDKISYMPPFVLGRALEGGAVGEVIASESDAFRPGDLVRSMMGWREVFNARPTALERIEAGNLTPQTFLGAAGMPGLTAYAGLLRLAELKPSDVVFVSAAAGAVGSIAVQIARIKGATVIGSAGGPEKCAFVRSLGAHIAIDYRAEPDLTAALARAAPDGIDVYFDSVGGDHLDAALASARPLGRFALCGMIAEYNEAGAGVRNLMAAVTKDVTLRGFLVNRHYDLEDAFLADMRGWIGEGRITVRETVAEGLENAVPAFLSLFSGGNVGKMLVRLA